MPRRKIVSKLRYYGFSVKHCWSSLGLLGQEKLSLIIVFSSNLELERFISSGIGPSLEESLRALLKQFGYPAQPAQSYKISAHSYEKVLAAGGYYYYFKEC